MPQKPCWHAKTRETHFVLQPRSKAEKRVELKGWMGARLRCTSELLMAFQGPLYSLSVSRCPDWPG